MKRILTHLAYPLILSLCLFTSCSGGSQETAAKVAEATPTTTVANETPAEPEAPADTTAAEPSPAETTETSPATTPSTGGSNGLGAHEVDEERLAIVLDNIAAELEAQNLAYISSKGQDCSGIYHKIKDLIQKRISALGDKSKYIYPEYAKDRNTRQVAHWYHKHNNLHIVKDAMAERNLIRPGSVMFYGRTEEKFNNPSIEILSNADVFQHDGAAGKGKIYHVGVVTNVEKDENGNVVRYTLMHGRNSKHNASRTDGNWDGPGGYGKAFAKFPFGNWNQQWVAVANIETPK